MPEKARAAIAAAVDDGRVTWTSEPTEVAPGLFATGAVPRFTDYELPSPAFCEDIVGREKDLIPDDQALFFESKDGTVVLFGCAHSGVVNTMRCIAHVTGGRKLHAVIGGMHLHDASPTRLRRTVGALADFGVSSSRQAIAPGTRSSRGCGRRLPAVQGRTVRACPLSSTCRRRPFGVEIAFRSAIIAALSLAERFQYPYVDFEGKPAAASGYLEVASGRAHTAVAASRKRRHTRLEVPHHPGRGRSRRLPKAQASSGRRWSPTIPRRRSTPTPRRARASRQAPTHGRLPASAAESTLRRDTVDVLNSGTTLHFAMGSFSLLRQGRAVLTGDAQIQRRPAGPLAASLIELGARCGPSATTAARRSRWRGACAAAGRLSTARRRSGFRAFLSTRLWPTATRMISVPYLNEAPYAHMTLWWLAKEGIEVDYADGPERGAGQGRPDVSARSTCGFRPTSLRRRSSSRPGRLAATK